MMTLAIIVGAGPSARGFVAPECVDVYAVNGAVEWLNRCDFWFTLDPSEVNISRMKNQRPGVAYFAAVPLDWPPLPPRVMRLNRHAERYRTPPKPACSPEWWLWRWSAVRGIPDDYPTIHTGNSAWGALQLAYKFGAREILLVGIDATEDERIEGGKCNNLSHLPLLFRSALSKCNVYTLGTMPGIPTITLEDFLK